MTTAVRELLYGPRFSPYRLPGLAARYSLEGGESDATYLTNGLGRVRLIADRSGNSAENCLVLNGTASNYASAPDSAALSVTGDIDIRARVAATDWTPATTQNLVAKAITGTNQRSYQFQLTTSGGLNLNWTTDGTAGTERDLGVGSIGVTDMTAKWVRVTLDVDNGAGGCTARFYVSDDGTNWTQTGTDQVGAGTTSIFDSTAALEIGSRNSGAERVFAGQIYRAQVRNGIDGTIAFDADFTQVAKLAASFTESSSNAATVTINTSGDLGARISGARDLVQFTTSKMALLSTGADGKNLATFDGSNDYMKAAPFSFSQPESVYFVGSQVTWTGGDTWFDGNGLNSGHLQQDIATPEVRMWAGASLGRLSLTLGDRAVWRCVFNGASSVLGLNRRTPLTGNAGSNNMLGFTIGSLADTTSAGNITFNEALLRSAADADSTQLRIATFLMRKWGIAA